MGFPRLGVCTDAVDAGPPRERTCPMGETSWAFLLVGSFAAAGAALALGTLAAILRYHRTGLLPGQETPVEVPRVRLIAMWTRVAIGVVLTAIGIWALMRAGLL
jgi:hypothetical protein